jgi:hypothetical protein
VIATLDYCIVGLQPINAKDDINAIGVELDKRSWENEASDIDFVAMAYL